MVVHLEKFSIDFSSLSFAIRVNLLHPYPSSFLLGLLLLLSVFFYLSKLIFCGFPHVEGYFAHRR